MPSTRTSAATGGCWRTFATVLGLLLAGSPGVARAEPPVAPGPRAAAVTTQLPEASEPAPLFAYVAGAVGLSGLSVAAVTGFLAMNQQGVAEDHCSPTLRLCDGAGRQASETGRTLRDISTAAAIVGGLGVGLSAYLLLSAPTRQQQVLVSVSVDGASPKASLVARF
ncbi:MAG TPA: hypothetical protein VFK05_05330 [Polyangiaceae bacterium]|nr:hypothetical protein [Polyangiaceae bacterium]